MVRPKTSTLSSAVGLFGYLLGHALLCVPLLLWAVADHAGRATLAKLGVRMDHGRGG